MSQSARDRRRPGVDRRRGPGPWIVLVAVAVLPVLALAALRSWSTSQVDGNEAAPPITTTTATTTTDAFVPTPSPAQSTGMIAFRRVPTIISRDLNTDAFAAEVSPLLGSLNDRSCAAVSVDGEAIGERNADIAVIPASNQKIPIAAAALERLGADFRYTTTVVAASAPVGGVVDGDLFLVGGGDPLLSSDWYPTSNLERYPVTSPTSLDSLADLVAAAGVTGVNGAIVGDGSRYDDEYFAPVGVTGSPGSKGARTTH